MRILGKRFSKITVVVIAGFIIFLFCGKNPVENHEPDLHSIIVNGINDIQMEYDGLMREFTVHLPENFNSDSAYPIVFFFHGLGGNKDFGRAVIGPLVDEEQFIGIYPQGYQNSWNAGSGAVPSTEDDVGFTLSILDWLDDEVFIDEERIYSMGYSNGGAFSYTLALETDRFAAVGSMSASFFEGRIIAPDVEKCSVMHIHGELDAKVPFHGGQSSALTIRFQSAMNTVLQWAVHNGLDPNPSTITQDSLITYAFSGLGIPHEVQLIVMKGTTHHIITHPFISTNDCYSVIWEFFNKHPKQ